MLCYTFAVEIDGVEQHNGSYQIHVNAYADTENDARRVAATYLEPNEAVGRLLSVS